MAARPIVFRAVARVAPRRHELRTRSAVQLLPGVSSTYVAERLEQRMLLSNAYTVTNLGNPFSSGAQTYGVNNSGEVVGSAEDQSSGAFVEHAFLYNGTLPLQDLGNLSESGAGATAINDLTQIVGNSGGFGFLWSGGSMKQLELATGATGEYADGINNAGEITGVDYTDSGAYAAFWDSAGHPQQLNQAFVNTRSFGINNRGDVVGQTSNNHPGYDHAFVAFTGGIPQDLGTLGGLSSGANAINDSGELVGSSSRATGADHAVLWTAAGGMQDLGTLGGQSSEAMAINNDGDIVGEADVGNMQHAFVYSNGQMLDLNNLIPAGTGWVLWNADAINDRGQIAGYGNNGAFLLSPVPASGLQINLTFDPSVNALPNSAQV